VPTPRWWEVRRAQNRKPATYRCPLCDEYLPALSEHMLLFPEGDHARRRHAHARCVMAARAAGRLPTRAEWQRAQHAQRAQRAGGAGGEEPGARPRPWQRLRERLTGRSD
jgi:hypothetical protein